MPQHKYYAKIEQAQRAAQDAQSPHLAPFDFNVLGSTSGVSQLKLRALQTGIRLVYRAARSFAPVFRLAGIVHVVRDREVRQVLNNPDHFRVPFGPEMKELAKGETFVLGLDGPAHTRQNQIIRQAVRPEDGQWIAEHTRKFGAALLENSAGQIDAMNDYVKRVVSEVCVRYFGFAVQDSDAFADWTISASALLFADPFGSPATRALALNGSVRICAVIDDAISTAQQLVRKGIASEGGFEPLAVRFVRLQAEDASITDLEIRTMLYGLVTGFVPTNSIAAGKMLDEMVRRPIAFNAAKRAAASGDRQAFKDIILELGRLNPTLSPGQWRYCPAAAEIDVDGKPYKVSAGSLLMVSTMSALRDKRAIPKPEAFWPERADATGKRIEPDLIFGTGAHECIGKYMAIEQITESLLVLLSQKGIAPARGKAGKMKFSGPFPRHLSLTYKVPAAEQSMFLVVMPVSSGADKATVDKDIATLGNPAGGVIRAALDATGLVHFASLATIAADESLHISFELSCDGGVDDALRGVVEGAGEHLTPILRHAGWSAGEDVFSFLRRHIVDLHLKPWGANGINFNALSQFPVSLVDRQTRFADFAGRVVRDYVASETSRGSHPMLLMSHLRRILRADPLLMAEATPAQRDLIDEARREGFDAFNMLTDASRLQFSRYRPKSHLASAFNFLKSKDAFPLTLPPLIMFTVIAALFWRATGWAQGVELFAALFKSFFLTLGICLVLIGAFFVRLRRAEKTDVPDTREAPLEHLHALLAQENPPGFAQNHIMAVGTMKPGWFRAFVHAFALWGIRNVIVYGFRPGFVQNMGTIHYARWWRLPGTNKVTFYSNFDGSWESYLEDFIARSRRGKTAAWSNWQGFPRTRFLINMGAEDGDAFKKWARTQQQVVPFWYSRFPQLTSEQIRSNGLVHIGAALAKTSTECEEWLRCFGSMPRIDNKIESDEVQALLFRGLKRLPYSVNLALHLPPAGEMLGDWLSWIRGRPMRVDGLGDESQIKGLVDQGILLPVPRPAGQPAEYALAQSLSVAFGDRPLTGNDSVTGAAVIRSDYDASGLAHQDAKASTSRAIFVALSAAGMAKFTAPNMKADGLLSAFPPSFRMGMAARDKIMGDFGEDAPAHWRWRDDAREAGATEAMVMLYAVSREDLAQMVEIHSALIANHGGAIVSQSECGPAHHDPDKVDFEHFGYRDGISQPVIKGASRSLRGVPEIDVVEPGEFILGYRNGAGFFPPSPILPAEADMRGALPIVVDGNLSRFPDFGEKSFANAPRDLGRNGSFIVIRELSQDVDGFNAFVTSTVERLNSGGLCDLYKLVGQFPDADWVKAKLMGRWPNGRPLIGNPVNIASSVSTRAAEMENDFSYGADDPQGLACPFGAHIRRTNPRDSKQPGDEQEQFISNRHRLLRRGRPYQRADNGEKGLFFASFCTDIERQFEFVQQFWANAPAFHGLEREPDPFIGSDPIDPVKGGSCPRVFTIPTPAGPVQIDGLKKFVHTRAGGYFFMPSRSALGWLTDISHHLPIAQSKEPAA